MNRKNPVVYNMKPDYDYSDDDCDNEGFVFDFGPSQLQQTPVVEQNQTTFPTPTTATTNNDLSQVPKAPQTTTTQRFDEDWDESNSYSGKTVANTPAVVYQLKNNYFFDEAEILLKDLKEAICANNLDKVKALMKKNNLDVNCRLKSNWSPLMYAVTCGSFSMTSYFIENGADINFEDDTYSVILGACGCSDPASNEHDLIKIVELLIKKGINVNSCDKYFQTPLIYASKAGNAELVEFLIKQNADINAADDNNWTALAWSCHKGLMKCVHRLLRYNADPLIYSNDFLYPFDLAVKAGYFEIKKLIKNCLRCKKIDRLKSDKKALADYFNDEADNLDEDDGLVNERKSYKQVMEEDLEAFLNAVKLPKLIGLFRMHKVTMKDLLNFNEKDLIKIGVDDSTTREVILLELKKFHKSNWKSNSILSVSDGLALSCNEIIAMASNVSRQIDYMTTNVKYILSQGIEGNKELFGDNCLTSKCYTELEQAKSNSISLNQILTSVTSVFKRKASDLKAKPKDMVTGDEKSLLKNGSSSFSTTFRVTAFAAVSITTLFFAKTKLLS